MTYETIQLYDGDEPIEAKLIASFSLDETNYCCLEVDGERFLAEYYEEGDDMVFSPVEDEEEFNEAAQALEELLEEKESEEFSDLDE